MNKRVIYIALAVGAFIIGAAALIASLTGGDQLYYEAETDARTVKQRLTRSLPIRGGQSSPRPSHR